MPPRCLAVILTSASDRLIAPATALPAVDLAIVQWSFDKGKQAAFATADSTAPAVAARSERDGGYAQHTG